MRVLIASYLESHLLRNLRGATLGIVGLGAVGREIGRLAQATGVRVVATRPDRRAGRRARTAHRCGLPGRLRELLGESDYVAFILPHTVETTGLIGKAELQATKQGAVMINISRGAIMDEQAVIDALRSGHLGGAALDVFAVEPLPADSHLWDIPYVLVTPHSRGSSSGGKATKEATSRPLLLCVRAAAAAGTSVPSAQPTFLLGRRRQTARHYPTSPRSRHNGMDTRRPSRHNVR